MNILCPRWCILILYPWMYGIPCFLYAPDFIYYSLMLVTHFIYFIYYSLMLVSVSGKFFLPFYKIHLGRQVKNNFFFKCRCDYYQHTCFLQSYLITTIWELDNPKQTSMEWGCDFLPSSIFPLPSFYPSAYFLKLYIN